MAKIKLLYTLSSLHGGGAERIGINLLKNFDRKKFDCGLFLHKKEGQYLRQLPDAVQLQYLLTEAHNTLIRKLLSVIVLPWLLLRMIAIGQKYDVLVAGLESTYITYATILSGLLNKKPVIVIVHNDISNNTALKQTFHFQIIKWLYPYCTQCICVSKGVMDGVVNEIPQLAGKATVLYNPLAIGDIFKMGQEPIDADIKKPYIVTSGRLEKIKRFDLLIRAHYKVLNKGIAHQLVIVGEGNCKNELLQLIEELGVASSVLLTGFDNNPYRWVSKAHCFVLCSENEGFGNVIVEALAVNTPVISTDCPSGPREILDNGKYGILVSNKNLDELADAIVTMFNNPEQYNYYKSVSFRRSEIFSIEKVIVEWEELIEKVYLHFYDTPQKA